MSDHGPTADNWRAAMQVAETEWADDADALQVVRYVRRVAEACQFADENPPPSTEPAEVTADERDAAEKPLTCACGDYTCAEDGLWRSNKALGTLAGYLKHTCETCGTRFGPGRRIEWLPTDPAPAAEITAVWCDVWGMMCADPRGERWRGAARTIRERDARIAKLEQERDEASAKLAKAERERDAAENRAAHAMESLGDAISELDAMRAETAERAAWERVAEPYRARIEAVGWTLELALVDECTPPVCISYPNSPCSLAVRYWGDFSGYPTEDWLEEAAQWAEAHPKWQEDPEITMPPKATRTLRCVLMGKRRAEPAPDPEPDAPAKPHPNWPARCTRDGHCCIECANQWIDGPPCTTILGIPRCSHAYDTPDGIVRRERDGDGLLCYFKPKQRD